jgi:hypothetical protein
MDHAWGGGERGLKLQWYHWIDGWRVSKSKKVIDAAGLFKRKLNFQRPQVELLWRGLLNW